MTRDQLLTLVRSQPHREPYRAVAASMLTAAEMAELFNPGATAAPPPPVDRLVTLPSGRVIPVRSPKPAPATGPGPALHRLLAENGLAAEGCAECAAWSAKMSAWGIEGCRGEHREEILGRLRAAAAKRGWLRNGWTGLKLMRHAWFDASRPYDSILNEALRRAEENP